MLFDYSSYVMEEPVDLLQVSKSDQTEFRFDHFRESWYTLTLQVSPTTKPKLLAPV